MFIFDTKNANISFVEAMQYMFSHYSLPTFTLEEYYKARAELLSYNGANMAEKYKEFFDKYWDSTLKNLSNFSKKLNNFSFSLYATDDIFDFDKINYDKIGDELYRFTSPNILDVYGFNYMDKKLRDIISVDYLNEPCDNYNDFDNVYWRDNCYEVTPFYLYEVAVLLYQLDCFITHYCSTNKSYIKAIAKSHILNNRQLSNEEVKVLCNYIINNK